MDLRRVVTVLDRPNRPQTALKRTLRICHDLGHAVQVEPVSFLYSALVESGSAFDAKERKALKKQLLAKQHEWADKLASQNPDVGDVRVVWDRHLAEWVIDQCGTADLVVKTASGSKRARSASDWALLTSCPTNLLLVGHKRVRQPQVVIAALDLEHTDKLHQDLNRKVLDAAASMAKMSNAELHVACAAEVSPALLDLDVISEYQAQRRLVKKSKERLDKLLGPYEVKKKNRHFPVGKIGQAMADCAKSLHADLLVVGTRARPVAQSLGVGNSAQRILRKAPCDVLAVRPER